jgi:serine protease Do
MEVKTLKGVFIGLILGVVLVSLGFVFFGKLADKKEAKNETVVNKEVVNEESVVTSVVEKATPSVVTVSISKTKTDPLNFLNNNDVGATQNVEQDVGSGFIISDDGLIVTNKHVVVDTDAKYKVVVGKDEVVEVVEIYRDPLNDLAILKINKSGLNAVILGDSSKLKVGQSVIAIGTALGEFRSTVTTGVISGLGRGIVAGSAAEGSEKLDNVIQTDAAINPGNSGGPLFNSSGEVIGVNVAVSASGQNIGFALPINLVKDSVANFKTTGEFERPYLGVGYKMVSKEAAATNGVVAGAYVQSVADGSPAGKAGIMINDIITEIDGQKLDDSDNGDLVKIINTKKIGDSIEVKVWRNKVEQIMKVVLEKKEN